MRFQIIDAMNLIHATKHVVRGDADQRGGMAIHIALNAMLKAWNMFECNHVVVALEGGKSWRKKALPSYKGHRKLKLLERSQREVEDDEIFFEYSEGFIKLLSERTNVTVLHAEGAEADDMIARWIQLHPEDQHVLISNDTDFYQLLAPNVTIYRPQQREIVDLTSIINSETDEVIIDKKTNNPKKPPEPKWELFKKICKGDGSDNILPAVPPRTRETKIRAAYEDQKGKGYDFNNLMLEEFENPLYDSEDKNSKQYMRVLDRFYENQKLIDLTMQPEDVTERMNESIIAAVEADAIPASKIGFSFMRFCNDYQLVRIGEQMQKFTPMLTATYGEKDAS